MKPFIHFAGERFGSRVLVAYHGSGGWAWRCDCGATGRGSPSWVRASTCRRCTPNVKSRLLTINGKTQAIGAWARELGLSRQAVHQRMDEGWDWREALTAPRRRGPLPTKRAIGVA